MAQLNTATHLFLPCDGLSLILRVGSDEPVLLK